MTSRFNAPARCTSDSPSGDGLQARTRRIAHHVSNGLGEVRLLEWQEKKRFCQQCPGCLLRIFSNWL